MPRKRTRETPQNPPLRFSLEAPDRPAVPVVLRGRLAAGVRKVAAETGTPLEETFARLLREGLARVTS